LPPVAQFSPVFGIISEDFNKDGNLDILVCGNDYGAEVSNGRLDASNGLVLKGDGKGNFEPLTIEQSGIYIPDNAKSLVKLKRKSGGILIIASQNKGKLEAFRLNK